MVYVLIVAAETRRVFIHLCSWSGTDLTISDLISPECGLP